MKSTFAALILPLALVCAARSARADNDPLRAFDAGSMAGARKLASTIAGTSWTYHLGHRDYSFRFGPEGLIEAFKQWQQVHWRVVSPTEVLLDRPEGGSVVFEFNGDATTFACHDWGSQAATGSRAGAKPAPEDSDSRAYFGSGH